MEIHAAGKSYLVEALEQETTPRLSSRIWFILKQDPQNDIEFEEAERLSIIWYYMTYYQCRYHPDLEEKVQAIAQKYYI